MQDNHSSSHGKSKQRIPEAEKSENERVKRVLMQKLSDLYDLEVARNGGHRYRSLKTFETVETLLHPSPSPVAYPSTSKGRARSYAEDNAQRSRKQPDVIAPNKKGLATKQEELHDCSVTSSFHSLSTYDDDATDVEPEMYDEEPQHVGESKFFEIGDEKEVLKFVLDRCKRLQQVPMKKIAKLWIKGICPKKQAVFPYSSNKAGVVNRDERQPAWWPTDNCQFREPDHVGRDERNYLCAHLLRLRPTAERLRTWNGEKMVPNEIHETQGWTKFLASLAPVSCLEELREKNKDKAARRRVLLQQLYDVALMEEEFHDGGRDGTDIFTYTDPDGQVAPSKRQRRERGTAKGNSKSSAVSQDVTPSSVKRRRGLPEERKPSIVNKGTVTIDADAMDIDPYLHQPSAIPLQAKAGPSRVRTRSKAAQDFAKCEPDHTLRQNQTKSEQPWEAPRDVTAVAEYQQHEPMCTPRPVRPHIIVPYANHPWPTYADGPNMIPPYPPPEIQVYQMRGAPQPQFQANPGQQFHPFNNPVPAHNLAGLPAGEHEQGDYMMQQYSTSQMASPASAGPFAPFGDYYGFQHPPSAPEQVHENWWTYPTDADTAWPAGLPELTNQCHQHFH